MKGGVVVTHTNREWHWIWTILSSCFHSILKKRESPKATSMAHQNHRWDPQKKEKQQTKWIKTTTLLLVVARRLLLLPSKLDHLYNLTQLYPDPHPPDNQTFLALGNFRGYNWAFVKLWLLLDRIRKMTSLKLWSVTTDCSTHTDPKSPYFVQKIIFNAFLSQNLNFLAWKNTY